MNWTRLFADCMIDLLENNVSVYLSKDEFIQMNEEGDVCRGLWDDGEKKNLKLYCATAGDEKIWVPIFVHEYCHFLQWKDRCPEWKGAQKYTEEDDRKILRNEKMHPVRLRNSIKRIRDLEEDCEKRTVQVLKKYGANKAFIEGYIQRANTYLYFYTYLKFYREWYPKDKVVTKMKQITRVAPKTFQKSYDVIPSKMLKEYMKVYPPKVEIK